VAEAASDPQVIVDFDFDSDRGLLFVGVRNLGERPAVDIATDFDKPFRGLGGRREMNRLRLFKRIRFLAPGREVRTLVDSSAAYFARREPTLLTATVSYRTMTGERRRHAITHDLSIYRDLAYVPEGETDA
jgi:hypothetical protein